MKKLLLFAILFISFMNFAQTPQGISYQAIALNSSGNPVANSNVNVRLSILNNSASGTVIYSETQLKTTTAQGLFNLTIGQGTPISGTFATINWETNAKFLKVEIDITGGTTFALVGTTQLLSVPYALYAETAQSVEAANIVGYNDSEARIPGFVTSDTAYAFLYGNNAPNQWSSHAISGEPLKIVGSDFNIGVLTTTHAYVALTNPYTFDDEWYSIALTGTPIKIVSSGGMVGVLTTTNAYALAYNVNANNVLTFNWFTQPIVGIPKDIYPLFRGFGVITSTNAYGFGKTISNSSPASTCSWYSSAPLSGSFIQTRVNEEFFSIFTTTTGYTFGPVSNNDGIPSFSWSSANMSGTYFDSAK
ncbi:hypothetical protein [Flavobacterium terrisoli]|uniref:hypothetical protein n=1 Tax=Flavobacterium terrisoli TaxID=3242195 RepID=UPI0025435976|nr:hypothetical protein [Flavobacterium buctense]